MGRSHRNQQGSGQAPFQHQNQRQTNAQGSGQGQLGCNQWDGFSPEPRGPIGQMGMAPGYQQQQQPNQQQQRQGNQQGNQQQQRQQSGQRQQGNQQQQRQGNQQQSGGQGQQGGVQRRPYWTCLNCAASENWVAHSHCPACFCPRPVGTRYTDPALLAAQQARLAANPANNARPAPAAALPGAGAAPLPPPPGDGVPPPPPALSPAEETASIKLTLKNKRDFVKMTTALLVANPGDVFYARVLHETERVIAGLVARLETLRPPEAQLAQVLGAVQHKKGAVAKLQAEVEALDTQRAVVASSLLAAEGELGELQARLRSLSVAPTDAPAPLTPFSAIHELLAKLGATADPAAVAALETLQARVNTLTPDVVMPPAGDVTPRGAGAAPQPFDPMPHSGPSPFSQDGLPAFTNMGPSPFAATRPAHGGPSAAAVAAGAAAGAAASAAAMAEVTQDEAKAAAQQAAAAAAVEQAAAEYNRLNPPPCAAAAPPGAALPGGPPPGRPRTGRGRSIPSKVDLTNDKDEAEDRASRSPPAHGRVARAAAALETKRRMDLVPGAEETDSDGEKSQVNSTPGK
jgi:hypothetical protein